jgi:hypothetical protein
LRQEAYLGSIENCRKIKLVYTQFQTPFFLPSAFRPSAEQKIMHMQACEADPTSSAAEKVMLHATPLARDPHHTTKKKSSTTTPRII